MSIYLLRHIRIYSIIELFFLIGFVYITYKYNIYVLYGLLSCFFLFNKQSNRLYLSLFFLFSCLALLYFVMHDASSCFRCIKTMVVFLPFYFTSTLQKSQYNLSKIFDVFMTLNACLVCVDFFLYFLIGQTLFHAEVSGFMPRPCGLLEDSNFFSYLMLVYVLYLKWKSGRYKKICVLSLFFSGSFSAIITFLLLLLLLKIKAINENGGLKWRIVIIGTTITCMVCYDIVAIHSDTVLDFIYNFHGNDLLKVKLYSMSHRFDVVSNAFSENNNYWFGIGAGKTRSLSDIGLNLHNSLLQMILEMGFILFGVTLLVIVIMMCKIRDIRYLLLFCAILALSSVMETIYNPLLSFVYFLSFSKHGSFS